MKEIQEGFKKQNHVANHVVYDFTLIWKMCVEKRRVWPLLPRKCCLIIVPLKTGSSEWFGLMTYRWRRQTLQLGQEGVFFAVGYRLAHWQSHDTEPQKYSQMPPTPLPSVQGRLLQWNICCLSYFRIVESRSISSCSSLLWLVSLFVLSSYQIIINYMHMTLTRFVIPCQLSYC